ncbi:MAG: hypothetical protein V4850_22965 [Myxococcota bacterium]
MRTDAPFFALSWMGGGAERAFRRRRSGVDDLPWGTLRPVDHPPVLVDRARLAWTDGAYVEYATAVQLSTIVEGLLRVRAPIDLVGMAGDFVADEMLHVELHARVVAELGGAVPYRVSEAVLHPAPVFPERPLLDLAWNMVRTCCIGETLAVPVLAATRKVANHPLVEAVFARIVEDEGPHSQLGWLFLEWAELTDDDRARLTVLARRELESIAHTWRDPRSTVRDGVTTEGYAVDAVHTLGWLDSEAYVSTAGAAAAQIGARLARFGIVV